MSRVETVRLDSLVPYWRNPRDNKVAVEKVMESIRAYGYQSPIVVDEKYTIIVGHTRYAALKQLGYEEVQVVVSDLDAKKAKEYRLIDNRTSEYAEWTPDLFLELKEFTDPVSLDIFFPHIDLNTDFGDTKATSLTDDDIEELEDELARKYAEMDAKRQGEQTIEIVCVHCLKPNVVRKSDILTNGKWKEAEDGAQDQVEA